MRHGLFLALFFSEKTYLNESIASRIADFKAGAKDEECPAIGTTFNVAKGRDFRNVQALTGGQIKSFRPCRMVQGMWAIRPQSSRSCWESKKQPFLGAHAAQVKWKKCGRRSENTKWTGFSKPKVILSHVDACSNKIPSKFKIVIVSASYVTVCGFKPH